MQSVPTFPTCTISRDGLKTVPYISPLHRSHALRGVPWSFYILSPGIARAEALALQGTSGSRGLKPSRYRGRRDREG